MRSALTTSLNLGKERSFFFGCKLFWISAPRTCSIRNGSCTKSRNQNPEWTKSRIGKNPSRQNPALDKIPNGKNPELDKTPNGQNPELYKVPNRQNPDRKKIQNEQNLELDIIPIGQNQEWTKSRMDKIQIGKKSRMHIAQKSRMEPTSKIENIRIIRVPTAGLYSISINFYKWPIFRQNCMSFFCLCRGDLEKQCIYKNRVIKSKKFAVLSS